MRTLRTSLFYAKEGSRIPADGNLPPQRLAPDETPHERCTVTRSSSESTQSHLWRRIAAERAGFSMSDAAPGGPRASGNGIPILSALILSPSNYGDSPWRQEAGPRAFQPFPEKTTCFGDDTKRWTVNFRVRKMDKMAVRQ